MENLQTNKSSTNQPPKAKPPQKLIPLILGVAICTVGILAGTGFITLPNINFLSNVNKITPEATVGVPCSYEFSELITFLNKENNIGTDIYTYYLGSGVGFPPMGLILGIDGVLKGTPTAAGLSKFQVCVKDVGGNSTCQTYSLKVNPANTADNTTCPATSNPPCGSSENGVAVTGVIVPGSCNCPNDTNFAQMDNITAGGPYKICTCK